MPSHPLEEQILVIAPRAPDGQSIAAALIEVPVPVKLCAGLPECCRALATQGAGLLIIAQEALKPSRMFPLTAWLNQQPEWSELPLLVLTRKGEADGAGRRAPNALNGAVGSVALLERPWRRQTLLNAVQVALRSRHRQLRLRDLLAQLRLQATTLQASANAILITNRDGLIQWANPAFERLTGYSLGEALGQSSRIVRSGKQDAAFFKRLWATILAGRIWHGELVNKRKDGSLYSEEMTITPVKDAQGSITHFIAVKQDVTPRKQAEDALRESQTRLARELENTVQQRTASLREAIAELEGFSYSLVHDLRAPLRAMLSYASIIQLEAGPRLQSQETELLAKLKTAALRMDQLVTDSLNYSRILRQDLPLATVDLGALLRGIVETYPNLHVAHADIRLELGELLVYGNQAALTQVFANLLDNAVKFVTPGGRPRVRVWSQPATLNQQPSTTHVLVWTEDNGIGIPREGQEKIFDMFHRMHRADEYPGTGIGLAIVKKSIERTGGRICVDSEPGKGSRFGVELPLGTPAPGTS